MTLTSFVAIQTEMLLAQVSRHWREAVDSEITKLAPTCLSEDIALRFPQLHTLDLKYCSKQGWPWFLEAALLFYPNLEELLNWEAQPTTADLLNGLPVDEAFLSLALNRVTKLTVSDMHYGDELTSYVNWPGLRDLRIISAQSTNYFPFQLCMLEEVTYLDLSGTRSVRG